MNLIDIVKIPAVTYSDGQKIIDVKWMPNCDYGYIVPGDEWHNLLHGIYLTIPRTYLVLNNFRKI